jgi:hypothetical protein
MTPHFPLCINVLGQPLPKPRGKRSHVRRREVGPVTVDEGVTDNRRTCLFETEDGCRTDEVSALYLGAGDHRVVALLGGEEGYAGVVSTPPS